MRSEYKPSILIVGDDPTVVTDTEQEVGRVGFSVVGVAADLRAAVELATARQPDVILMDVACEINSDGSRPGTVLSRDLRFPVVYVTDPDRDGSIDWSRVGEPFGVLTMPFDGRRLEASVQVAIKRSAREASLRAAGGLLDTVFQSFPSPMLLVEPNGVVVMCNEKARRMFGMDCAGGDPLSLNRVVRCLQSDTGQPCACSQACDDCELLHTIRDAIAGDVVEDRRCEVGLFAGNSDRRVILNVSAIGFEHNEMSRAILVMEDRTEFERLRSLYEDQHTFSGIVGGTDVMRRVFETIREVAEVDLPVLIQGETGTGKELVARAIHDRGPRSAHPFVPVNCGAIPDGLLESELFGHVKGAFTGALRERQGRFTLADRGTIFLDEIGDLSPSVQVKLLRVLQEGTYEPVGSERTLTANVRVISATNKHLANEVIAGRFRKDLYYRLCVLPIDLPPLRERPADIPLIADHLLARAAVTDPSDPVHLSDDVVALLADHGWSGNVRELDNVLQFARMKCRGGMIRPDHLPPSFRIRTVPPPTTATAAEREPTARAALDQTSVADAITKADGNRTRAAQLLGVSRATLYRFLARNPV
jgi:DNA-binding NtrC family response regulator